VGGSRLPSPLGRRTANVCAAGLDADRDGRAAHGDPRTWWPSPSRRWPYGTCPCAPLAAAGAEAGPACPSSLGILASAAGMPTAAFRWVPPPRRRRAGCIGRRKRRGPVLGHRGKKRGSGCDDAARPVWPGAASPTHACIDRVPVACWPGGVWPTRPLRRAWSLQGRFSAALPGVHIRPGAPSRSWTDAGRRDLRCPRLGAQERRRFVTRRNPHRALERGRGVLALAGRGLRMPRRETRTASRFLAVGVFFASAVPSGAQSLGAPVTLRGLPLNCVQKKTVLRPGHGSCAPPLSGVRFRVAFRRRRCHGRPR